MPKRVLKLLNEFQVSTELATRPKKTAWYKPMIVSGVFDTPSFMFELCLPDYAQRCWMCPLADSYRLKFVRMNSRVLVHLTPKLDGGVARLNYYTSKS